MENSKKVILIARIILIVIIVGGIGGYFVYQYIEENKSTGTDWGDTYYKILNSMAESNQGKNNYISLVETEAEDTTVQFIEVEEDEIPYMIVSYSKDDEDKVMICKLNEPDNASTSVSIRIDGASVEYLYNISLEQDIWYLHFGNSITDTYKPLYTEIERVEEEKTEGGYTEEIVEIVENEETQDVEKTYTISKDSKTSVETVDGETLSISEYEQTFVEIEVDESSKITLDFDNMSSKEMKIAITEAISNYKTNNEILTEETATTVAEKVEEVNTKLAEIQEVEEAVAAKEAEEKAAKGLTVGNYTLKYGTYSGDSYLKDSVTGGTYVINQDGTFTFSNTWTNMLGENYIDTGSGTYSTRTGTTGASIWFTFNSFYSTYEDRNSSFDMENAYTILEDNCFGYVQDVGSFIYQED